MRRLALVLMLSAGGCTLPAPDEAVVAPEHVFEKHLRFLARGETTRDDVRSRLGQPARVYENGRVLAYRLLLVEEGVTATVKDYDNAIGRETVAGSLGVANAERGRQFHVKRREGIDRAGRLLSIAHPEAEEHTFEVLAREAEYHLVLVVDARGLISDFSFVRILP